LRRLESALRIVDDRSINTIPENPADQRRLARRLGYQDGNISKAEEALREEVHRRTAEVRTLYDRVLQELRARLPDTTLEGAKHGAE
jgi:glutamine synthetase adenylyltransferase